MSFREKTEWATLVALIGGFGWYYFSLYQAIQAAGSSIEDGPGMWLNIGLLVVAVIIITVVMIITTVFFAVRTPDEANAPADEREKLISLRATRIAYCFILVALMGIFAAAHIGHGVYFLLNLLIGIIVISEIVRVATSLWLYRRG